MVQRSEQQLQAGPWPPQCGLRSPSIGISEQQGEKVPKAKHISLIKIDPVCLTQIDVY